MTRWLILVVIVLIPPSRLIAVERPLPVHDAEDNSEQSSWNTGAQITSVIEPESNITADQDSVLVIPAESNPAFQNTTFRVQDESDVANESSTNGTWEDCYYPMCEHQCLVECLDSWCVCSCEESYCTTDEWCCHPCQCSHGNCRQDECGNWFTNDHWCDVWGESATSYDSGLRLGYWAVSTEGSNNKIGEFQDLESSPFWDLDVISSNGERTLDLTMSGLDNEANNARWFYYGSGITAKGRFDRFLRRLDHDVLQGADINGPLGPNDNVVTQDLNVGEDYAIRVQQLDARFQGRITDNVKWRLNVWGQRKFGERQVNATAHCFDVDPSAAANNVCHVLSERQQIDWLTMEIQPAIEARFENTTIEYSRTMRGFGQDDEAVFRTYSRFAPFNTGAPFMYAFAPESFTQIDRLKINSAITDTDQLYANLYLGDMENKFRDTHRQIGGFDVRWTNHSIQDMTVTTYTSMYDENNQLPPFLLPEETAASVQAALRHPVDHTRTRAGIKGNWYPNGYLDNSMLWVGGYEYLLHTRDYSVYDTVLGRFTQPDTKVHQVELGPNRRWSESLSTYARYKVRFIEDPLIGVRENNGRFNTNQPEQEHRVELGGTWMPAANLMATTQFSIVNRWHQSAFADFNEDDYPFTYTIWYAPSDRLSLTGGYGYYSNWIDQDITLGFRFNVGDQTETTRWSYEGENHLLSLNAVYAWTPTVNLMAGYEWDYGKNVFFVPPSPAGADWSLLPSLSDVNVKTQRWTAGVDWQAYSDMYIFGRYNLFDYQDDSGNPVSGVAHMALGGVSWFR